MNKLLVIGNWKMNAASPQEAVRIARGSRRIAGKLSRTDVIVCPPFPLIPSAIPRKKFPHFHVGAQSVSVEEGGSHTGEVSAAMLRNLGAEYVIVGHSEERVRGDSDAIVSRKAQQALEKGLSAIVCIGEKIRDDAGAHLSSLKDQIKNSLSGIPKKHAKDVILAYEPIWAIGAKEAMPAGDVHETSLFVRKVVADIFGPESALKAKILYGGAVNFRNAPEIIRTGKVDGLLVGRESVNLPGFIELLKAVDSPAV